MLRARRYRTRLIVSCLTLCAGATACDLREPLAPAARAPGSPRLVSYGAASELGTFSYTAPCTENPYNYQNFCADYQERRLIALPAGKFRLTARVSGWVRFASMYRTCLPPVGPLGHADEAQGWPFAATRIIWRRGIYKELRVPLAPVNGDSGLVEGSIDVPDGGEVYYAFGYGQPMNSCYMVGDPIQIHLTIQPIIEQAALRLNCTPASLVRGDSIICVARAEPAGQSLVVTAWSFEGEPRTDGAPDDTVWAGPMVRSGTIRVRGRIGGGPEQDVTVTVDVRNRDWSGESPEVVTKRVPNGDPHTGAALVPEVQWIQDLGHTLYETEPDVTEMVNHGPNADYLYFRDLKFRATGYYSLNDEALLPNSLLTRAQEPDRSAAAAGERFGTLYCEQRDVPRQESRLADHEKTHVRIYGDRFAEVLRPEYARFEQMVSKSDSTLTTVLDSVVSRASLDASLYSQSVVDAEHSPYLVRFLNSSGQTCTMRNVAGAELVNKPRANR